MGKSPKRRQSCSPSPVRCYRSRSRSHSRSSFSPSPVSKKDGPTNPGNNLYVTGLSTRVTEKWLEEYFSKEGKVVECCLVTDPLTRESRGFGFVTMDTLEDADRCIKYLHRSILDGRSITVEKAKRKRARTPTPGKYLGVRSAREISYSRRRGGYDSHRDGYRRYSSRGYSPYRGRRERSVSPGYSPYQSPRRGRSYRSPRRGRSYYSRSRSRSRSRSTSPYY